MSETSLLRIVIKGSWAGLGGEVKKNLDFEMLYQNSSQDSFFQFFFKDPNV